MSKIVDGIVKDIKSVPEKAKAKLNKRASPLKQARFIS